MLTVRTGVVRKGEGSDDELTALHRFHRAADFFDDAAVLVSHRRRLLDWTDASVRPKIRSADAGGSDSYDRIGRLFDSWIRPLLEADITRTVKNGGFHFFRPVLLIDEFLHPLDDFGVERFLDGEV